ncbi:MAG: sensor histidine kinase [Clostridiaceae bacterium]|nr:sensor histidine kinase [Clostridiaceae bacterium]
MAKRSTSSQSNKMRMLLGFRFKVLFAIAGITLTACTLISFFFFRLSAQTVENNYLHLQERTLRVTMRSLEELMSSAYDTTVALTCDDALTDMAHRYIETHGGLEDAQKISAYLKQYQPDGGLVDSIYLYLPARNQVITSADYHAVQEIFFAQNYPWMVYQSKCPTGTRLAPVLLYDEVNRAPQYVLAYTRPVYGTDGKPLGWLAVNLSERDLFYQLLSQGTQMGGDEYYLLDGDGVITMTTDTSAIGHLFTEVRPGGQLPTGTLNSVRYGEKQLLTSLHSPMTGFRLLCLSDREELVHDLRAQLGYIFIVMLITTLVMLLVALWVSRWIYAPVKNLKDAMHHVQEGDLSARATVWDNDEIGELSEGFNQTVEQVERLIGQLVEERMQKKEAELDALQYQITPHFMYNTLNSIKYAAMLQGADRIGEQLGAFIELLQASISRQGAFLTVEEEIHMVENYVKLQKFRYMDAFEVVYCIEPETKRLYVPRLILQPLVENAILHGTKLHRSDCRIEIAVQLNGPSLILRVTDNGTGMTEQEVNALMSGQRLARKGGFSGIGIPNIRERLKLYYGDMGQLHYSSSPGFGTRAVITLPASRSASEYEI